MKDYLLTFLLILFGITSYAQLQFEEGYYIDNSNQTIACQIKNTDWNNNPSEFEYRLSKDTESQKTDITSVKEFGIYKISKYVRSSVEIDRSSEDFNNLDYSRNPKFTEEVLFLKVLIEGKSNLYEYVDGNLTRYFYTKEDSNIEQLVYKSYKLSENKIAKNNGFRQQLWNELKCQNYKSNKIEALDYRKNDLVRFFTSYNKCHDSGYIVYDEKEKRNGFNLNLRARLNHTSLIIQNELSVPKETDFGNKLGFGIGLEAEIILPINNNKWSILIEPTFQYFKSEKSTDVNYLSGGKLISTTDYNSLEVPLGLRYYFFQRSESKIYINTSLLFDIISKSSIAFTRADGSKLNTLDISTGLNLALGIGYKYNDKYCLEFRYHTSRNVLADYVSWTSDYNTFSVILGHSIF